eukprot:6946041-Pyramimonas_sp.AAC.4
MLAHDQRIDGQSTKRRKKHHTGTTIPRHSYTTTYTWPTVGSSPALRSNARAQNRAHPSDDCPCATSVALLMPLKSANGSAPPDPPPEPLPPLWSNAPGVLRRFVSATVVGRVGV